MNQLKKILSLVISSVLLTSCVSTTKVSLDLIRPADIHLDKDITTILLVDRTEPEKKALGIIEGLLTGESPFEDKAAVQQLISSLRNEIQVSPRFDVTSSSNRLKGNSFSSAFPPQIPWTSINSLCYRYKTQAVVSVEIFDTDFIITDGKRRVKKTVGTGKDKKEIEVDEYYAEGVGNIKIGIRLYDQVNHRIIDEQLINKTNTWSSAASSKADALAQLISRSNATQELAKRVGSNYALKIAPLPIRVDRSFYKKSKKAPALAQGTRFADVGQWQEAIKAWEAGIVSAEEKYAGRLAYNISVANEVLGNLDEAINWAQKAYTNFGNKKARNYVSQLQSRKIDEQRLKDQMGG